MGAPAAMSCTTGAAKADQPTQDFNAGVVMRRPFRDHRKSRTPRASLLPRSSSLTHFRHICPLEIARVDRPSAGPGFSLAARQARQAGRSGAPGRQAPGRRLQFLSFRVLCSGVDGPHVLQSSPAARRRSPAGLCPARCGPGPDHERAHDRDRDREREHGRDRGQYRDHEFGLGQA